MSNVLLSISGHDRPGIVRDVAESMLHLKANIEDSSMTALRGRFTMMMIVKLPEDRSISELKASLAELEQRTRLTVQSQVISDEEASSQALEPDHVITVHGADTVGIVHAVTNALAALNFSIVDVSTRSKASDDGDVYLMVLEVVAGSQSKALKSAMKNVAGDLDIDVEVHTLDDAVL
ncbi:glycine cleavage system transcriptional repressor [Mariprofundus ferrinatatus]|uniref:Glycine cleavage system transcriptional repressor n=1 Tax=Mariprofundus ferrinatatus TaxID=1921087 RepID=A0A2K8L8B2_9PROT|nr:ACT domain-containing protein [Mariprofundus ferrinatatus]ATX81174.1 glycine cleavage system transcriptional repressor [Mariprofundus ferrinatatus]